jgi:Type II secretion system (T2SS), protein G
MKKVAAAVVFSVIAMAAYMPTDIERARWTIADMLTWRTAIEAYATDHGVYPDAKTLEELRDAVQPLYIAHAPMHDAWGNPYRYERDDKIGFRLISAGADGAFDPSTWSTGGRTTSFNDDAVVTPRERWMFRYWDLR